MKHYLFTLLAAVGLAAPFVSPSAQAAQGDASFVTITNAITSDTRWTRDKVYILTRMIFVRNNATLTIEPGTIVRGVRKGSGGSDFLREPGTLIISRTGKLIANGTPDAPIIFTSIDDINVAGGIQTVPNSYRNAQGNVKTVVPKNYSTAGPTATNAFAYCEEWGGLVILGRTYVAQGTGLGGTPGDLSSGRVFNDNGLVSNDSVFKGADVIEGIDATQVPNASGASSLKLGVYGGNLDNDNSGVIRFVSVRYCGDVIGTSNELNSITMGAMGNSTVFEHVETTFNTDDGYEWFGGKVDLRFLFSHYNRDDNFDCDEGVRITGQFFSCVQGSDVENRSGFGNNTPTGHDLNSTGGNFYNQLMEIDGPEPNNSGELPATQVDLFNYTMLGNGALAPDSEAGIRYRLGARGNLFNGLCELSFGVTATGIAKTSAGSGDFILNVDRLWLSGFTTSSVGAANNQFTAATNQQSGASNVTSNLPLTINGYDPRIPLASPARVQQGAAYIPSNASTSGFATATNNPNTIFVPVRYSGSQRDNTQLQGWSHIQALNLLPTSHPERIQITLGLNANNPTVSFSVGDYVGASDATVANRAIFVIERSADGRVWVPVTTAVDGDAGDDNPAIGTVEVTDGDTDITTDGLMLYRAYAL